MGAMTLILISSTMEVGVSQGFNPFNPFNPQIDVALERLKNATNYLKDAEASTGL